VGDPSTTTGIIGRPSLATAEKGERLPAAFSHLFEEHLTVLREQPSVRTRRICVTSSRCAALGSELVSLEQLPTGAILASDDGRDVGKG
jgi:hypothetical protein